MNVGELNKGAITLILVLLLGAGGYLWYSQLYKPAVELKATATVTASTAEQGLATANTELAAAQQRIEDSRKENSKPDDSISRLAVARAGVPSEDLLDDAAIVLGDMAERSGVDTRFKGGDVGGAGATGDVPVASGTLQGATPIDLEFEAAGTYAEMMEFMRLVESTVEMDKSTLYSRGRLFNVVRLKIGDEEGASDTAGFDDLEGGGPQDSDALMVGPKDILFKVTVRMYTSSTANAQSVGGATADPAAVADPAAAGIPATDTAGVPEAGGASTVTAPAGAAPVAGAPIAGSTELQAPVGAVTGGS